MIEDELTLGDYAAVLRRRLWVVVAAVVLIGGLAAVWSETQTPMYRSTARVLLNQANTAEIFDVQSLQNAQFADRLAENEVALIESQLVDDVAEERLGFEAEVSASIQSSADVVSVSAEDADPEVAQQIAQTYVDAYLDVRLEQYVNDRVAVAERLLQRIAQIDEQILGASFNDAARLQDLRDGLATQYDQLNISADLATSSGARIIDAADLAEAPFVPQTERNLALGLVLGVIVGVGLALLLESLDRSVRTRDVLEAAAPGVPALAVIPSIRRSPESVALDDLDGTDTEAFRTLRAALEFASVDEAAQVVQVTSAGAAAGKTTIAANLAVVLAQAGRTVALVDADLRRPRIHKLFDLPSDIGLTPAILGRTNLIDSAREVPLDNGRLWVYPSGPLPPGPAELLGSKRTRWLFETLGQSFDVVVVDSPPVLPVADALVLSRMADATVLVANAKRTRRDELSEAFDALQQAGARIIGTILNQASAEQGYGYGYGYGYAHDTGRRRRLAGLGWRRSKRGGHDTTRLDRSEVPRFEPAAGRRERQPVEPEQLNGNKPIAVPVSQSTPPEASPEAPQPWGDLVTFD